MTGEEIIVTVIVLAAASSLVWRFVGFCRSNKQSDDKACGNNDCDC